MFRCSTRNSWIPMTRKLSKALSGPKYDGQHLSMIINEKLQDKRLHETVTNVVIPTFDIKTMNPVIFSTYGLEKKPDMDAKLADICIGTSAAPTFLPGHSFNTRDSKGNILREFNLVDGGMAANNPTLVAMNEVTKHITRSDPHYFPVKPTQYERFLVLSLGTGEKEFKPKYDALAASKWGVFGWLVSGGSSPLLDIFTSASGAMADFHIATMFQALHSGNNYLRIQDDTLKGDTASTDLATPENLKNLVKVGENLLTKPMRKFELETGLFKLSPDTTNACALKRFARILHQEKSKRTQRLLHGRKGKSKL